MALTTRPQQADVDAALAAIDRLAQLVCLQHAAPGKVGVSIKAGECARYQACNRWRLSRRPLSSWAHSSRLGTPLAPLEGAQAARGCNRQNKNMLPPNMSLGLRLALLAHRLQRSL